MNSNNISDFAVINASLTTTNTMGYTVLERLIDLIRNLQVEENKTSFQISIGGASESLNMTTERALHLWFPTFSRRYIVQVIFSSKG